MNLTRWTAFVSMLMLTVMSSANYAQNLPHSDQDMKSSADEKNWPLVNSLNFPVWIVSDAIMPDARGGRREIFLFLPDKYFKQENLCAVFRKLSSEMPDPLSLEIVAFSDKSMLRRAIAPRLPVGLIDFQENAGGRRDEREMAEKYLPAEKGYFRAYYNRSQGYEKFKFSKDPQSGQYTWINLQGDPKEDYVMSLIEVIRYGDVQAAQSLITQGVNREVQARTGNALISNLPEKNKAQIIRLLIDSGENINGRDQFGWTPLMRAAGKGDSDLIAILLKHGADTNLRNMAGETALLIAARLEYPEAVSALIENGCNPDQIDAYGRMALMLAVHNSDLKSMKALLLKGANPNALNREERTALFYVKAQSGNIDTVVRTLVEAGANINARDKNGDTALIAAVDGIAANEEQINLSLIIIQALLKNGADPNLKNNEGFSALDMARKQKGGNSRIPQFLADQIRKYQ